jgi:outer membrane protein, multidrug efflux system
MRPLFILPLAAFLLASCASAPLKNASEPVTPVAAFTGPKATGTLAEMPSAGAWWLIFRDPALDDLVARALDNNNDIKIAQGRLDQARGFLGAARADLWPQAGLAYAANRATVDGAAPKASNRHSLDLELSYEVDLTGRLRSASKAAYLDARASSALLDDTRLLITTRVAQSYFALRALDEDRAIVRDTLEAYRGSLSTTQKRFNEGFVAELDVARLQTEVAATEAEALSLDQQAAQVRHALAILIGENPSSFTLAEQPWAKGPWATEVPAIPTAISSVVLRQRPDVQAAEARFEAEQKRVGIAETAWFPSLTLTGNGGYGVEGLGKMFDEAAKRFSITGIVSQAVFDGGARNGVIKSAKGGRDVAFAQYRQSVLGAYGDVEDQLSDLSFLEARQKAQDEASAAADRALAMAQSRYKNGADSQLELLDAQRQNLSIRRQALKVRAARYLSTVGLIRAVGGKWSA